MLISHDLNLAGELCDRLLLMQDGRSAALGTAEAVLSEPQLEAVFGCRVVVDKHPTSRRPTVSVVWPDAKGGDRPS